MAGPGRPRLQLLAPEIVGLPPAHARALLPFANAGYHNALTCRMRTPLGTLPAKVPLGAPRGNRTPNVRHKDAEEFARIRVLSLY